MAQKSIQVLASGTGTPSEVSGFPVPRTFIFRGVSSADKINIEVSLDNVTWSTFKQVIGPDPGPIVAKNWFAYVRARRIAGTGTCTLSIGAANLTENDPRAYNFMRKAATNEDSDADPVIVGRVKEPIRLLNGFFALREDVTTTADDYFVIAFWTKNPSLDWVKRLEYIVQNANLLHTEFYGFNPVSVDAVELPENSLIGYTVSQAGMGVATPDIYFQIEGEEFTPNA